MFIISGAAACMDNVLQRSTFDGFRKSMDRIITLVSGREEKATTAAHSLYCEFFDRIYGSRTLSVRRIVASLISTIIAFFAVVISIGIHDTIVGEIWQLVLSRKADIKPSMSNIATASILIGLIVFMLNAIPDFISLAETRLILRWAEGRGPAVVLLLTVVDIVLTTAIFLVIPTVILIVAMEFGPELSYIVADSRQYGTQQFLLPFLLTTYVTSMLWFMFVGTFVLVKMISLISPLFVRAIGALAHSRRRTLALSSLANVTILLVGTLVIQVADRLSLEPIPQAKGSWDADGLIEIDRVYKGNFRERTYYLVWFEVEQGRLYTAEARIYGLGADTEIAIFDSSGCWYDDDSGVRLLGSVAHFAPDGARAELRVGAFGGVEAPWSDFTIKVFVSEETVKEDARWNCDDVVR